MKATVKLLKTENMAGTSKAGNEYDMDFAHFLDTQTYDKFRLVVDKTQIAGVAGLVGKEGMLECGIDPRTEKPYFIGFKAAA